MMQNFKINFYYDKDRFFSKKTSEPVDLFLDKIRDLGHSVKFHQVKHLDDQLMFRLGNLSTFQR